MLGQPGKGGLAATSDDDDERNGDDDDAQPWYPMPSPSSSQGSLCDGGDYYEDDVEANTRANAGGAGAGKGKGKGVGKDGAVGAHETAAGKGAVFMCAATHS